jgi:hypothetical protein
MRIVRVQPIWPLERTGGQNTFVRLVQVASETALGEEKVDESQRQVRTASGLEYRSPAEIG